LFECYQLKNNADYLILKHEDQPKSADFNHSCDSGVILPGILYLKELVGYRRC